MRLLNKTYKPVLESSVAAQAKILGVEFLDVARKAGPADDSRARRARIVACEIYRCENMIFGIKSTINNGVLIEDNKTGRKIPGTASTVWAFHVRIGDTENGESDRFNNLIAEFLGVPLKISNSETEPVRRFKDQDPPPVPATRPSTSEVTAARLLSDRTAKSLAVAIKASNGGLLACDLDKQVPAKESTRVDKVTESLSDCGVIEREYVIVCKQSQGAIARLPNIDAVSILEREGIRCACGAAVTNERLEEAVKITKLGQALIDKSHWSTVLLVDELLLSGVPLEDIFVEQQSGGDEMDCIAIINGYLVLFELKDKEFNLGNAYSFSAKMGLLRPDASVIVTSMKVGNDARNHFEKAAAAAVGAQRMYDPWDEPEARHVSYIEGMENLRNELGALIDGFSIDDANGYFKDLLPWASIRATDLFGALYKK